MNTQGPRLGAHFTSRRERGSAGLPTLSVTLDRGLVPRDSLERRTETNLSPEEHLRVRRGDIAYNMMRMWQGASGLAEMDALVSPAYVVLAPKKSIDPLFAAYLFKLPEMIHRFWAYSYGLTNDRLRLYFNDFKRIPWDIPTLPEQKKISEILYSWDKAIETTEKLLANAEEQKRALMQQMVAGKRRLSGFEGEWETISLGELGETYGGLTGKSKEDFGSGAPYITYMMVFGNSAIDMSKVDLVTIDPKEAQHRVKKGDIFFTTSSETPDEVGMSSVLLEDPGECYLNSFCFGYRLHKTASLIPEFARYLLRGQTFRRDIRKLAQGATRYNLSKRELMKLQIKLPPADEQREIAKVLDNATDAVEGLKQQLARLAAEKRALMQQLLTGKRRVTV